MFVKERRTARTASAQGPGGSSGRGSVRARWPAQQHHWTLNVLHTVTPARRILEPIGMGASGATIPNETPEDSAITACGAASTVTISSHLKTAFDAVHWSAICTATAVGLVDTSLTCTVSPAPESRRHGGARMVSMETAHDLVRLLLGRSNSLAGVIPRWQGQC